VRRHGAHRPRVAQALRSQLFGCQPGEHFHHVQALFDNHLIDAHAATVNRRDARANSLAALALPGLADVEPADRAAARWRRGRGHGASG